jgi:hypothetical protein
MFTHSSRNVEIRSELVLLEKLEGRVVAGELKSLMD